jgi:hypothetical protein
MLPVLRLLGYELEYQRAAVQIGGASFTISHRVGDEEGAPPVHIVAHGEKLDERGKARQARHALVQDYLNRSDCLWGMVTNGRKLRLLRDSKRFARPTYVEFDLEAMVAGNLCSEFVVLFRLAHRTRLPRATADAHESWLERYYQQGIAEGSRVRERLSEGVHQALLTLGSGFLGHHGSAKLRSTPRRCPRSRRDRSPTGSPRACASPGPSTGGERLRQGKVALLPGASADARDRAVGLRLGMRSSIGRYLRSQAHLGDRRRSPCRRDRGARARRDRGVAGACADPGRATR